MMTNSNLTEFLKDETQPAVIRYLEAIFDLSDRLELDDWNANSANSAWLESTEMVDELLQRLKTNNTLRARRYQMVLSGAKSGYRHELGCYNLVTEIVTLVSLLRRLHIKIGCCEQLRDKMLWIDEIIVKILNGDSHSTAGKLAERSQKQFTDNASSISGAIVSYRYKEDQIKGHICQLLTLAYSTDEPVGTKDLYPTSAQVYNSGPIYELGFVDDSFSKCQERLSLTCELADELGITGNSPLTKELTESIDVVCHEVKQCLEANSQIDMIVELWQTLSEIEMNGE